MSRVKHASVEPGCRGIVFNKQLQFTRRVPSSSVKETDVLAGTVFHRLFEVVDRFVGNLNEHDPAVRSNRTGKALGCYRSPHSDLDNGIALVDH